MSAVPNKQPFDVGRAVYLALNLSLLVFLLAPIAIVLIFALNPTPYISFPPVGVSLRWFEKFFASPDFTNALLLSLWVAGCVLVFEPRNVSRTFSRTASWVLPAPVSAFFTFCAASLDKPSSRTFRSSAPMCMPPTSPTRPPNASGIATCTAWT